MDLSPTLALALGILAGGLIALLLGFLWYRAALARERLRLTTELTAAQTSLETERSNRFEQQELLHGLQSERAELDKALALADQRVAQSEETMEAQREFLEESRKELENSFKALAQTALAGSNKQFLELAEQRLGRTQSEAKGELEKRKQAIEALLVPLRDTLTRLDTRTGDLEKARVDAYAKMDQQIRALAEQTIRLEDKTTSLTSALRGSQVRGRWGEIALRNIAELSGMTEHCDFYEQKTLEDGGRPDMVVRLPGKRLIAVDAKAPLKAYLASLEADSDKARNAALDQHVQDLRNHIRALDARNYAEGLGAEVDLVVMFLPGDPFLAAAFTRDPNVQVEALRSKVLIATPTTLVALLRTVAIYWQQRAMAENAEQIAATARTLYERAEVFARHLDHVGKGLRGAVDSYNSAVASFERRLLPMGRQLEEMKVTEQTKKTLDSLEEVEETPRGVPSQLPFPGKAFESDPAPEPTEPR